MAQKGAWPRSRDLLFKCRDPRNICGMADDRNLKFCMPIEVRDTKPQNGKSQKGAWPKSRDLLSNFATPLISLGRLKIQTSKFARGLMARDTKPENEN